MYETLALGDKCEARMLVPRVQRPKGVASLNS